MEVTDGRSDGVLGLGAVKLSESSSTSSITVETNLWPLAFVSEKVQHFRGVVVVVVVRKDLACGFMSIDKWRAVHRQELITRIQAGTQWGHVGIT